MTTTLTLIDTRKIDTRRDGAISFAQVQVLLDGVPVGATFKARVGEESIVIDGDTITVSDAQVEALRSAQAHHTADRARRNAELETKIAARIAIYEGFVAAGAWSREKADAAAAFTREHAVEMADGLSNASFRTRDAYKALLARFA